jgi:dTDP-4-dehydrorhamnose 3,5-epimerase
VPVKFVETKRFSDDRGWFAESYNRDRFFQLGIEAEFVQDNHSMSRERGVLRGLHFQTPPHAQAKLVRCVRGGIWDVAVDIRIGSPTYAQWVARELTAENGVQTFVPVGFAHGFITLKPDTEVEYKTSDFYAPECEGGVIWNDPDLGLPWPIPGSGPVLSEKDLRLSTLAKLNSPFEYDGHPLTPLDS